MGGEERSEAEENLRLHHGIAEQERSLARFLCAPQHRVGGGDVPDVSGQRGVGPVACRAGSSTVLC